MFEIMIAYALGVITALFVWVFIDRAPEGYQDQDGFHRIGPSTNELRRLKDPIFPSSGRPRLVLVTRTSDVDSRDPDRN
jgi:hypothetical protein